MRRVFWVPTLLLLDALAFHDILVSEQDAWMEWAILGLSLAAYVLLLILVMRRRRITQVSDREKW